MSDQDFFDHERREEIKRALETVAESRERQHAEDARELMGDPRFRRWLAFSLDRMGVYDRPTVEPMTIGYRAAGFDLRQTTAGHAPEQAALMEKERIDEALHVRNQLSRLDAPSA